MRYFTDRRKNEQRKEFYYFFKDEETRGIQVFDGLNEELTLEEIHELIDGLTIAYKKISKEEYEERPLGQITYEVNHAFEICKVGPHYKKEFRKDLKRHYTILCTNCLGEISTKDHGEYWAAQTHHVKIHGEKFCSEWCVNKYSEELKQSAIKERRIRYGV